MRVLDWPALESRLPAMREAFAGADPFPHIVIDDFLDADACAALLEEYDSAVGEDDWNHYRHFNERKLGMTRLDRMGPRSKEILVELFSDRFLGWLGALAEIDALVPDAELDGGGLHKIERGGFLNVHADFLSHTRKPNWSRQLNLLLYLNRDWREDWGGALELWDADMRRAVRAVAPVFNRCVIFRTTEASYHGHPTPLACPPDRSRKSLALYYFRDEQAPLRLRPTHYRPRPEDSAWKRALVVADRGALRVFSFLKRYAGLDDRAVSRLLKRLR